MAPPQSAPRVVPALISCWAALLFLVVLFHPDILFLERDYGEATPVFALFRGVAYLCACVGVTRAALGAAHLRPRPVTVILVLLVGCPATLIGKAYSNPDSSFWILCALIVPVSGFSAWYLLRPSVRAVWSRGNTAPAA
jgi:hypothetical protein